MKWLKLKDNDEIVNSNKKVLIINDKQEVRIARIVRDAQFGLVGKTRWEAMQNITHYAIIEAPQDDTGVNNSPSKQVAELVQYWNDKGIKRKRKIAPALSKVIQTRLKTYTMEEIKEAIDNYDTILKNDTCLYTHKFEFTAFMKQANGMEKFLDETVELADKINTDKKDISTMSINEPSLYLR